MSLRIVFFLKQIFQLRVQSSDLCIIVTKSFPKAADLTESLFEIEGSKRERESNRLQRSSLDVLLT